MKKFASKIITLLMLVCLLMPLTAVYGAQPTTNPTQAGQTPSGIPFSELESRIDALVAEHLGVTAPGVAIVVVSNGEIIFSRGYGYADIERSVLVDPATTVFAHGSMGKAFVWVAAMQLVEQGLLDLDADINTYLSAQARSQFAFEMPFTMRDLMNHTAGFEDVMHNFVTLVSPNWELFSLRDALLSSQPTQIFTPSTVSAYSNWGTALAAYVIEQISGQSFATFEVENILAPIGMTNTLNAPYWSGNSAFIQSRATPHQRNSGGGFLETQPSYFILYPAGSTQGTAEDFARFIMALTPPTGKSGYLFDNYTTLSQFFSSSSHDPINRPATYHGLYRYNGILPAFGHSGEIAASFSANFGIVPEERFGWVVMANASSEIDIRFGLTDLLIGNSMNYVQPSPDNLPNASSVAGSFMPTQRIQSNLFEFMAYLGIQRVTAIDENHIELSMGGMSATYRQIEPYVFQIISADHPVFISMVSELRFVMENGSPALLITGSTDLSPLPSGRTTPFLITYVIILVISVIFFVVMPIVALIRFVVRKVRKTADNQTKFRYFGVGLLILGLVILVNNIMGAMTGIATNGAFTSAGLNFHIIANWVFAGVSAVVFIMSIFFFRKEIDEITTKSKVFYGVTSALLALFIFTLHNWNFFAVL